MCGIEFAKPVMDWLKEEMPEENFQMSYDHKFVHKEDGTRIEIPKELQSCGECPKKVFEIFKFWPLKHPLPDYIVKNVFGSWEDIQKYYTCPNDGHKDEL